MTLTTAAATTAVLAPQSGLIMLVTAKIDHDDLATPLYIVDNLEDISVAGQTYSAVGFQFTPPDELEQGHGAAEIVINNADLWLTPTIRTLNGDFLITFAVVSQLDLTASPPTFQVEKTYRPMRLNNVTYNSQMVRGDLSYQNILGRKAFKLRFTPSAFPGLFQ